MTPHVRGTCFFFFYSLKCNRKTTILFQQKIHLPRYCVILCIIYIYIYICIIPGKNSKNHGNQNFGADFCIVISFDFEPVLAFMRRFLTFCVVFVAMASATSCQDADFFSKYDIHIEMSVLCCPKTGVHYIEMLTHLKTRYE